MLEAKLSSCFGSQLFQLKQQVRKGGSAKYSTASHHGLAVAMDSARSKAFEVACWTSANWRCAMSRAKWFVVRKPSTCSWDNCHISQSDCAAKIPAEVQKACASDSRFLLEGGLGLRLATGLFCEQRQVLSLAQVFAIAMWLNAGSDTALPHYRKPNLALLTMI